MKLKLVVLLFYVIIVPFEFKASQGYKIFDPCDLKFTLLFTAIVDVFLILMDMASFYYNTKNVQDFIHIIEFFTSICKIAYFIKLVTIHYNEGCNIFWKSYPLQYNVMMANIILFYCLVTLLGGVCIVGCCCHASKTFKRMVQRDIHNGYYSETYPLLG
jgi:hypothetical protein